MSKLFLDRLLEVWRPLQTFIYKEESISVSHSVVSDSLQLHGIQSTRLLCPWNSPGKNTGVGCHSLLPGVKGHFKSSQTSLEHLKCNIAVLEPLLNPSINSNLFLSPSFHSSQWCWHKFCQSYFKNMFRFYGLFSPKDTPKSSCLLSGLFSVFSTYIKQNNLLRLCQNNSWPCLNPLIGLFVCLFCFYRLGSQTQRALKVWRPLDGAARLLLWLVRQPGALFQMTHCHPLALALNITLLLEEVVHSHPIQINQPLFYHGILFLNRICNVFNHCFWVCILIAPFSAPECHLWEERGHICLVHCLILSTKKSAQGG